jgi:hypothetical protein
MAFVSLHAALALAASFTGAAADVAVLPLKGTASENDRRIGTRILLDALQGMEGLRILPIASVKEILGEGAQAALDACVADDDQCLVKATAALRYDALIAGAFDAEGRRGTLRLRLIATSTKALTNARIIREISEGGGESALRSAIVSSAIELFPEQAKRSFGTLALRGGVEGAEVYLDGARAEAMKSSDATLRVRPGPHAIRVLAPGRKPFAASADVLVGQKTDLELDLPKNRSATPYVLGGIGLVAAGAGLALGLAAKGIQHDWETACPNGQHCASGFGRARYDSDESALNRDKISSTGLFIVSGLALVAAVVWYVLDPGSDAEGSL